MSAHIATGGVSVCLHVAGQIDVTAETARLQKDLTKTSREIDQLRRKLADEHFTARAPAAVVDQERKRYTDRQDRAAKLQSSLARLAAPVS